MTSGPVPFLPPREGRLDRLPHPIDVVVIGGGLAGVAAATVLAERGARVHILERESFLGGRLGAWSDHLDATGEGFQMERGFHAFFRHYYNLRSLLRRVDPDLTRLVPLEDYPVLAPDGRLASFTDVPRRTPWNFLEIVRRTPSIGLRELLLVDKRAAFEMLRFDVTETFARFDHRSARDYLDALDFPPDARQLLFEVFAHSFFNPEGVMSAAELLMMFHYYFLANPEGLLFDVLDAPFSRAVWEPLAEYMTARGVSIELQHAVERVERLGARRWRVHALDATGEPCALEADAVVLAVPVPALKSIVSRSEDLDDPSWRHHISCLDVTNPFIVWRLWLDRPTRAGRDPFVGTVGHGVIDNISLYHLIEDESRDWAKAHGGAVVELHAYAVDPARDDDDLRRELLESLYTFYPETRDARILEDRYLRRQDCPAFPVHGGHHRPSVHTPYEGVTLAGDLVHLPIPSALMERATTSGMYAANLILADHDVRGEPLWSIPPRGPLARLMPERFFRAQL